jgi:cyclohexadienyl dehydratase
MRVVRVVPGRGAVARAVCIALIGALMSPFAANSASAESLADLMVARLALMPDVAAAKFASGQPVLDPTREAEVLEEVRRGALREGLVPETAATLFAAQMAAARQVQMYWIDRWQRGVDEPPQPPDLAGTVRPALSRLTPALLAAAAAVARGDAPSGLVDAVHALDAVTGLDAASRAALDTAVAGLRVYPDRLAQIREARVLRVGMTGDYAPFTWQDGAGNWSGIDVDLARDLAAAVAAELVFVPTRWTTLEQDLKAGAFDIAMGGVSRTLERQRIGFQTRPYYADGKTPVVRCADRARFAEFDAIDQPGVRVVVNPGGTNQRFANTRIRRADVRVHADNRTVFEEIAQGRADVMFTDRIEVEQVVQRLPALCAALAEDLTYQEKSYLLPQDSAWLAFVDTWLELRLAEGVIEERFAAHGSRWRAPRTGVPSGAASTRIDGARRARQKDVGKTGEPTP